MFLDIVHTSLLWCFLRATIYKMKHIPLILGGGVAAALVMTTALVSAGMIDQMNASGAAVYSVQYKTMSDYGSPAERFANEPAVVVVAPTTPENTQCTDTQSTCVRNAELLLKKCMAVVQGGQGATLEVSDKDGKPVKVSVSESWCRAQYVTQASVCSLQLTMCEAGVEGYEVDLEAEAELFSQTAQ